MRSIIVVAITFFSGIVGVNAALASEPTPCAALLAPAGSSADSSPSAESTIAAAWAELLTKDRALSESEATWLRSLSHRGDPFAPELHLFNSPIRESMEELRNLVEYLIHTKGLDTDILRAELLSERIRLLSESDHASSTASASEARRAETNVPIISLPTTGTGIIRDVLPLPEGRFAIANGSHLYFFGRSGEIEHTIQPGRGILSRPIRLSDGRILVGDRITGLHWISKDGRSVVTLNVPGGIEAPAVELPDHRVVVGTQWGRVLVLDSDGTLVSGSGAPDVMSKGPVEIDAIPLRDGGFAIAHKHGKVVFYDENGIEHGTYDPGTWIRGKPTLLKTGNLVAALHDGRLAFLRPDGSALKLFNQAPRGECSRPIELSDGTLLVAYRGPNWRVVRLSSEGELLQTVTSPDPHTDINPGTFTLLAGPKRADGTTPEGDFVVESFEIETGTNPAPRTLLWLDPISLRITRQLAIPGWSARIIPLRSGGLVATGSPSGLLVVGPDGTSSELIAPGQDFHASVTELPDGRVVAGAQDGKIFLIHPHLLSEHED